MNLRYHPPSTYFTHIPKTAGLAFAALLATVYQEKEILHLAPATLVKWQVGELSKYRHYHSWHQDRGMYELLGRNDLACITLLRDPVERVVSAIYFLQHTLLHAPHRLPSSIFTRFFPFRHATIVECLHHESFRPIVDELQTRQLGIKSDYSSFFAGGEAQRPDHFPDVQTPLLTDVPNAKQVFADACLWLDEMAVVGVTEHYAGSVSLTCDLLGVESPQHLWSSNVNPQRTDFAMRYRHQLEPAIVAEIEERNRYDIELYAYACERYEEQWSRYQVRPCRTYSLLPRLRQKRVQVRRLLRPAKQLAMSLLRKSQRK